MPQRLTRHTLIGLAFVAALVAVRPAQAGLADDVADALSPDAIEDRNDVDPLLDRLVAKGVLTPEEAKDIDREVADQNRFAIDLGGRINLDVIAYDGADYVEGVPGDPNLRTGFRLRTARFNADGRAYWDWLRYSMQVDFADPDKANEVEVTLLDARISLVDLVPMHAIHLGLVKPPFARQQLMSSSRLQFQERSIVLEELQDQFFDRELGARVNGRIPLGEDTVIVKYAAGVFNGSGERSIGGDTNEGKLVALRGAIDLFHDMGDEEPDLASGELGMSVGGGWFLNDDVASTPKGYAVDGELKLAGFSFTGGWVMIDYAPDLGANIEFPPFATDFNSKGWYVQGGYMLVPHLLELAGRYEQYDSNDQVNDNGDVTAYTGALNLYLLDHDMKSSLEYVARIEDEGAELENDSLTLEVQLLF